MPLFDITPYMNAYGTEILTAYMTIGFIMGFFVVREDCESPVGTWLFATVAGPLVGAAILFMLIPMAPFWLLTKLLGIEASESDTHGV